MAFRRHCLNVASSCLNPVSQLAERLTAGVIALLEHTDRAISEISYSLGFEEPEHFSRTFRRQAKVTLAAWRGCED